MARLTRSPNIIALSDKERRRRAQEAFAEYAENVLADDHLTAEEEAVFDEVSAGLGITAEDFHSRFNEVARRLLIAQANDRRLGVVESPSLITKRNEAVYLETPAGLMKKVVQREWQSGS